MLYNPFVRFMKHANAHDKHILRSVIVWKLLLMLAAVAAIPFLPLHYPMTIMRDLHHDFGLHLPYALKIWGNFDGFHYLFIAKDGYQQGIVPFFPLYPMLIRLAFTLTPIPRVLIGQGISLVCFVAALFVARRLFLIDQPNRARTWPLYLACVLTFPTAFFYSATYNDSLFFLLATATLLFAARTQWIPASIAGMLASVARLNGLVLFPFLIIAYLTHQMPINQTWNVKRFMARLRELRHAGAALRTIAWFLLVPLAFLVYLYSIEAMYGDWHLLFSAMKPWGQDRMILPPQVLWRYFKMLILTFQPQTYVWWIALFELTAVAFYLSLLVGSWKKIRLSYWVFFALSILIPSLTGTFQGMPRYGLHLYPMFLILTMWLSSKPRKTRVIYFSVAIILEFLAVALFTRGIFVA